MIFSFDDLIRGRKETPQQQVPQPQPQKAQPFNIGGAAKSIFNTVRNNPISIGALLPGPIGDFARVTNAGPKITPRQAASTTYSFTGQPITRGVFELRQTANKDYSKYEAPEGILSSVLGKEPLYNFNDERRTSEKVATKLGMPGLGAPLAIASLGLDATAFSPGGLVKGGAKKLVTKLPKFLSKADDAIKVAGKTDEFIDAGKKVVKNEPLALGPGNPTDRLSEVITEAYSNLPNRADLVRAMRGEKAPLIRQAYNNAGGGDEGIKAVNAVLTGKADDVAVTPLRNMLSESDVKHLLDRVVNSERLSDFEVKPAVDAMNKLLDGKTPVKSELEYLRVVFPDELVDVLTNVNRTRGDKIVDALNAPRTIMSSLDLSAPLRQGIFPAMSHPLDFAKSFKNMFKYAFSQKEFNKFQRSILDEKYYQQMRKAKVAFTDMQNISNREEAFLSSYAENLPGVGKFIRGSARAYTGFLNNFRVNLFNTLYEGGVKLGKGNDEKFIKDLGNFINTATGRGDWANVVGKRGGTVLNESAPLLNAGFFSPRLIASRISLFNPYYYYKLEPTVRKEAIRSLVTFVGTGLTILGAAKLGGADVGVNPTSSDFGKIKIGNTRYDIWGGFQPYAVYMARMITGEYTSSTSNKTKKYGTDFMDSSRYDATLKFGEGKLSPIASFGVEALKGQDFEYDPLDYTTTDPFKNPVMKRFLPIISNDLKDAIEEYGYLGPIVTVPGIFGVGQSTYGPKPKKKSSGRKAR